MKDARDKRLKVMHIVSGDSWAGAEVQAHTLLSELHNKVSLCVIVLNHGTLANRLREGGIKTEVFDESTKNSASIFWSILRAIWAFKPNVVHTHRQKENVLGSVAGLLCRVPASVRTVHGAPEIDPDSRQKLIAWLDHVAATHMQDALISVSEELSSKLRLEYPACTICTIPNGVNAARLRSGTRDIVLEPSLPGCTHVGFVGRLVPVKRVDIFLNMAKLILDEARGSTQSWHFHVLGEGHRERDCVLLAEQLDIQKHVTFHGHRADIHDYIKALDYIVMPSDHEGLPMTALEAMLLGTPLVAHKVGGLAEVMIDMPAMLVEDHSPMGYRDALIADVEDPGPKPILSDQYLADKNASRTLALYERLVEKL